ncbi:MAG: hypothetical protein K9J37_02805 [Saprospiraceae bacterium]|nr:hypothetical protein [Saprospiraceae bacterium]MCF8248811.1 hypothetical protein [Saprospiraceae bacterium]MCF8279898.1 hypothetical protein [Bacteroidales bacterium]MCF8310096.1 hypothetical protein [Saprospiraceae bacterium]MCF8438996.1 hypothetical protein [Saprospiraceae bacterium]
MNQSQTDFIKNVCEKSAALLLKQVSNTIKEHQPYEIDCSDLKDYTYGGSAGNICEIEEEFKRLMNIKDPVLYYFEIVSKTDKLKILEEIRNYRNFEGSRPIPAIKKSLNLESSILYVGRARCFWARLIVHLGYHKNSRKHGLQIYHWARMLSLQLRVHIFEFNSDMDALMPLLEYKLAKKLQPLIGKHKL